MFWGDGNVPKYVSSLRGFHVHLLQSETVQQLNNRRIIKIEKEYFGSKPWFESCEL